MERKDILGMEFDWFAVDQDGNFALFATGGAGPVPRQVFDSVERHEELAEGIGIAGWGSDCVWDSFSRVGLFAYDWRDAAKTYVRVAEPAQALSLPFAERLRASGLPRIAISFRLEAEVAFPWNRHGSPFPV